MPSRRWIRLFAASALASLSIACSDESPVEPDPIVPLAGLVVSDPSPDAQPLSVAALAVSARSTFASAPGGDVAYVSLPAGSLLDAISVTFRNLTTGSARTPAIPFVDGGFDPVPIRASVDDELALEITDARGAITLYRVIVPRRRPPRVVRTSPPKGTIDVALNASVTVVFTEPVMPATVTAATVQLLQGTVPVRGTLRLAAGSVSAVEFVPDEELASGTAYRLVVTQGVRDADGDALEVDFAAEFTTVTSVPRGATSIVAGWGHTCALRVDGSVLCWGQNWSGQLGAGNNLLGVGTCPTGTVDLVVLCSTVPVKVVGSQQFTSLASGFEHTCGLTVAGDVFCWGDNSGASGGEDWPPPCDPSTQACGCDPSSGRCSGVPLPVEGSLKFESIVAGYWHTCGLRVGGDAFCWGHELLVGGLGTGDAGVTPTPAAVRGGTPFTSLSSGAHHVCGLDQGGAAWCWGLNLADQLGFSGGESCAGPTTSAWKCARVPTRLGGALTFVGLTGGWQHTCGLTPTGRAYCWGDFLFAGAFGAVPQPMNDNLVFTALSSGASSSHACGVTLARVAYCWGRNDVGQLGDGSTTSTLVPVPVAGGVAFTAVAAGDEHSCGITVAGALYCWGSNRLGQLGTGTVPAGSLVPVRVAGQ